MKHVLRLEFEAFTNMENLIEQHCNNKDYNCVFFQRGFIDSMNKIFKVVWSKTKECYVVVSEVAKNNSGKKKVLASVLATLAIMGAGAQMGTPVQAGGNYGNSAVNVAPDNLAGKQYGNTVDKNSVVVGYLNTTKQESGDAADGEGHFIFGANNRASAASSLAVGNNNVATGGGSSAIGASSKATKAAALAVGNVARAEATGATAIGTHANADKDGNSLTVGEYSTAVGGWTNASGTNASAFGYKAQAKGLSSTAIGENAQSTGRKSAAVGLNTNASGTASAAMGIQNTASGNYSAAYGVVSKAAGEGAFAAGYRATATNKGSIAIGQYVNTEVGGTATNPTYADVTNGDNSTAVGSNSIASGENSSAFGYNNKVTGDNSTALGTGNVIDRRDSLSTVAGAVAVGNKNKASGDRAIAIGEENESKEADTITMGNKNTANTGGGIAIGKGNTANSTAGGGSAGINSQIAIGRDNQAVDEDTLAVGRENKATERLAMAIGNRTEATGVGSIAIGSNGAPDGTGLVPKTISSGTFSVALGAQTNSTGTASVAVGGLASATATSATAVGHGATANEQAAVAVGKKATVNEQATTSTYTYSGTGGAVVGGVNTSTKTIHKGNGTDSATDIYGSGDQIAIGSSATVSNESNAAVVIGKGAKTEGNAHYSVVVGKGSYANASDGVVVGQDSYVKARESVAIGQGANISNAGNVRSQAIGFGARVSGTTAYDALAIGSGAQVTDVTAGVALGSGSEVARKTSDNENIGFNSKIVDGTVVRNRAYTAEVNSLHDQWDRGAQLGAVSVGNDNQKRQIINVAAGNKDTDAVNVAQLKNVGIRVGADTNTATIGTNKVAADFLAYNGQLNIKGDSNRITTVSENDANGKDANVNVKFDYDGLVKAKAGSSVTVNQKTEGGKTVFEIDAAAGGATSTEKVQAKADIAGSSDKNIAKVAPKAGENFGDVGATYEVNVSRNDVKDAAREAVTVNNGGTTKADGSYTADSNNPISVTPTKDDTNHNTSYAVTFDGNKAAKQIPLTYKANGNGAKTVTLEKGLDFTNGTNTTAEIGNDGVVKYNLNKDVDLSNTGSLTVGGTTVNNGGITIKAPTTPGTITTTTDVKLTNTGLDNGGNKITNVAEGTNNTDAVNVKQLKENRTEVKAGDNVVVTTDVDATDNHTVYTVNAVTPAVYTTPNGEKLTKDKDGKFHKVGETAEYTGDIITSFENPKAAAGQTTKDGGMIVNNVGSAIKNQTGATYLDKLKAAADDNSNVKNAAVNVSDLKNTADGLTDKGLKFDANEGGVKTNKLGSTVTVQGSGALTAGKAYADEYNTANIRTKIEQGTDGNTTINVGLAKALKGINSISNGGSSITISDVPAGATTPAVTISGGNLSMGDGTTNNKIVNLAPGTANTDAVNVKQLKDTELHITPGTYTPGTDKKVKLTYTDGNGGVVSGKEAVIDLSGLSTGGTTASSWNVKSSANTTDGGAVADTHDANAQNIANGKSVEFQSGKNLVVKQTNDTTGGNATVEFSLADNIVAGKDGANGKDGSVGATGKDGSSVVINGADGSIGMTGPKGQNGKDGINGRDGADISMTSAKGEQVLVNRDPAHSADTDKAERIVYVPKDANGDPIKGADGKNIVREVATMDDGLKFAGDDAQGTDKSKVIAKKLNNTVDIIGGADKDKLTNNNIGVNNDNGKLKVQLAKTIDLTKDGSVTTGNTKIDNSGVTITVPTGGATTNVTLTQSGLDNGGNKITNVKAGTDNTDAVNVKQLKANRTEVKAGDNVVVTSAVDATDNHTIYTVNAVTPAVYTTPDGTKLTKDKDGKFHKEGETAEYTGDIITSFENPKAATGQTTKDGGMIVNNIGSAIKNQNPTMPAGQTATYLDKLKAAADAGSNVKNAAVNVSDLHNTAEALKSNELHIRPTVTNRTDETVNKNTAGTPESYKYDAATQSVTLKYNDGTGAGVTGTEAKIDLSDLANQITSGYTFKTNATENGGKVVNDAATPAAETAVANGGVVNYAAGKNLTVKQDIEKDGTGAATGKQTYTYALADEIGIGEKGQPGVAGKDGVDGKIGVNGKDGSSVVINGKDGSIGMTGPQGKDGKDGINGRDGANISMTSAKGEQVLINRDPAHSADTDKAERIVYVPKDASGNPIQDANGKNIVREVATMDDGLKFGGDMGTVNSVKLNKQVDVKGGITDTNKLATGNNIGVTSGIDPTTNNATLNVQLAKDLTGLNSVELGGKTIKTDGDHITITSPDTTPGAAPGATTITKVANLDDEKHIKAGSYAVQNDGSVTLNYQDGNNNDLTETAKITGIAKQDLSNINNAGKTVITGLGTIVKAGDNVSVSEAADATTGQKTYTVNAVTPAIYTDKNGNKVVKRPDGTYTTNLDGSTGNDVAANDVIVSFKDAAGNTTGGNSIVNNVGSAINNHATPGVTSPTYLDKLDAAAGDTKTQNAAVNVTDLHNTANALKDSELHIAPTAVKTGSTEAKGGTASGNTIPGAATQAYKYNATTKQVELTFNDGNGNAVANTKAVIDLSNLPTGGDMSSFHVTSSAESTTVGTHAGDTTQEIKDGKSIDFQAGKNMTVTQTNNSGNTVINYALDKNLDVESVHVGKDGKDGKIGIDGKDGVDGLNGTNRVDIHVEKGAKGVDGTDGHDGVNGHNGKDGMTRIVYEDKGGKQEVATLNDGLKFTGNNESTVNNHKLNTLVKVQGEGTKEGTNAAGAKEIQTSDGTKFESAKDNIAVVADGTDTLTVKLNKNLKGLDSVQTKTVVLGNPDAVNGTTNITYNPTDKRIEYVTPDAAGTGTTTNKVANLDDEKHIKAGSYAVQNDGSVTLNYQDGNNNDLTETAKITGIAKQDLSNIDNAGKTVITGLGTIVKAGDNVTVSEAADATTGQKTYTVNAVTPAIYTDKNGNKVVKRPDGTYTTNLDGSTGNDVAANDVIVSFKDAAGNTTGGNSIINNVGSAIKNQTPTMPTGVTATYLDKLKAAADDTKTQNAAVNVSDLHNTANALKDSELHIAPTVGGKDADKGGVASGNANPGAAAQAYKYNATTKQVELTFNDGNGKAVTGPKAVIDLSELAGSIQNYGFQTNADGNLKDGTTATATAVTSGKTVTYAAGKNLTVEQEIAANGNQTYTYALNKDLTNLDKVVVNGKDGIDGKDGVSITGPKGESAPGAKDGQDGKVGIAGKDGKDAVSISGKDGVGHIGLQGPKGTPGTPGADGASLDISTDHGTQTLVKPEANNDNKSERIVYVPKDKDGNPLKDTDGNVIKREVATMDDGLKFAGDDGTVIKKALGTQLDIVGGATGALSDNNIGVNNDNGKLKVQLAKDVNLTKDGSLTIGDTKVNNDGITITGGPSVTKTGINAGNKAISNVANGTNDSDAVNVSQLKGSITTVKSSDGSISVTDANASSTDPTKGHAYDIKINNQRVVEKAQTPVVYTDKDGHKLYKIVDPTTGNVTFNTKEDGTGTTVQPNEVIASMNNGGDSTITPMKLNNVGSSIQDPNSTDTFLKQLEDANTNTPNGAVNVSDLKKTSDALIDKGLVFDANNAEPKTNKLGSKVTIAGTGALANGENFADKYDTKNIRTNITQDGDGNTTVEIGLTKNLKGLESVSVPGKDGVDGQDGVSITGKDGANGIDGKVGIGKDGKDAVSISGKDGIGHIGLTGPAGKDGKNATADITVKEGKAGVDGKDGITRIVYNDKDGNEHQVATHDDGLKFTGNNVSTENKHKLNSVVKVQGEGVTENATSGKLEVNGQEFKSAAGNIAVVADGDKTLTVKMNKDLNLTKDGSVTMGDTVVNNDGITIKASTTPGTTDVKLTNQGLDNGGNKITNVAAGTANTDAVNVSQLKGSITTVKSSDGSITVTDANVGSTDPTKGHAYDIKVNNQGVVNNAQIPVVYTKDDGTKVYKQPDGTFNTAKDGSGDVVAANKVIASMNNAANSSTDPTKLQNVGSSIADKAGNTYLDKINAAAGDNHAKTGAVNVSDLKNTADAIGEKGLNFGTQSTGANSEIHKNLGEKLEIVGGGTKADDEYDASNIKTMTKDGKVVIALDKNIKADSVTVGEKGQPGVPGKNGMDGKIGVNGKDGSAVVINGKDGSIGLNGKDGANGITIKGDKGVDGVDGVNGTNGITRIVYQDKDGNNHEVATHDDGMKFAGDDGQTNQDTNPKVIKKHLNKVVDIVGGADKTKLTDNNIGVNNDGGKLRVQLANELSGINKISNGNSSISIADVPAGATTPAVTISGGNLSMGDGTHNNKIVNLAAGTNDTDAVNYKQLKDSRTTVTSQDGSVTITPTQNGDSTNYDLKVNPPLDPRVDQLAEEVGRVGAQGAALAALKPIQYDPLEPTQIMAGYGNYRGNSAIAMGVAHYKNESTLIHGGVSWAGGSSHMMANAGVTWKVGNRDSEAAVADRYRKGPISSTYAMQQEMAAMKAQNAGLKGEVSDLKAENEQMKAQIAAMMAKLGL